MKKIHHWIVRFVYIRKINILGYPSSRKMSIWWLYELYYRELWIDIAVKTDRLIKAVHAWVEELPP